MHEPLTTQLVAELMRDLLTAFPSKHSEKNLTHTAEVYRNGLRGVSGEALRAAVDVSIKSDTFFPKVARLRELATEWTKRNNVTPTVQFGSRVCRFCGVEPSPRERWRPAPGKRFVPIVSDDGMICLERHIRDICDCSGPCWYVPEPGQARVVNGITYETCKPEHVQHDYKQWREKANAQRGRSAEAAD